MFAFPAQLLCILFHSFLHCSYFCLPGILQCFLRHIVISIVNCSIFLDYLHLVLASPHSFVPVCTCACPSSLICARLYSFVLICTCLREENSRPLVVQLPVSSGMKHSASNIFCVLLTLITAQTLGRLGHLVVKDILLKIHL
jgi:hypothetical protein